MLVYAQMLVQQIDNEHSLLDPLAEPAAADQLPTSGGCCGSAAGSAGQPSTGLQAGGQDSSVGSVVAWFDCVWSSARACSSQGHSSGNRMSKIASYLLESLRALSGRLMSGAAALVWSVGQTVPALVSLWLARWRSPIVQRLAQSMLVQVYYMLDLSLGRVAADGSMDAALLWSH